MVATLEKEVVEKKKWITDDEMLNMLAIGESTPGPIAINLATFIGYKLRKFWGAFFCTFGFVLPSFIIISIISLFIDYVISVPIISWAFKGIRAGVLVLIGNACLKFFKKMDKTWFCFLMFFMTFFVSFFTDISVIILIIIGGVLGLIYSLSVAKIKSKQEIKENSATNNDVKSTKNLDDNNKINECEIVENGEFCPQIVGNSIINNEKKKDTDKSTDYGEEEIGANAIDNDIESSEQSEGENITNSLSTGEEIKTAEEAITKDNGNAVEDIKTIDSDKEAEEILVNVNDKAFNKITKDSDDVVEGIKAIDSSEKVEGIITSEIDKVAEKINTNNSGENDYLENITQKIDIDENSNEEGVK